MLHFPSIYLYAFIWLCIFLMSYYKNKRVGVGETIILLYLFSSISSIAYYHISANLRLLREDDLHIDAFLYLSLLIFICIWPFLHHSNTLSLLKVKTYNDNGLLLFFLKVSFPFLLYLFLDCVYGLISFDSSRLADVYRTNFDSEGKTQIGYQLSTIGKICRLYHNFFFYIWPIVLFVCLSSKKSIKNYAFVPAIGILSSVLLSYNAASRLGVFQQILFFAILLFLFKNTINKKIIGKVRLVFFAILGCSITLLTVISISRFNSDSQNSFFQWLLLYMGEGDIRFSQYAWELTRFSDGDTSFALTKYILGYDTYLDYFDRREHYLNILGIPTHIFYTFIGDWFIDFGKVKTVFLCLLFALLAELIIRSIKNDVNIGYGKVFALSIMIYMLSFGFMYYSFKTTPSVIQLIKSVLSLCLYLTYVNAKKSNCVNS